MTIYRSFSSRNIDPSLRTSYATGAQTISNFPCLVYFCIFTHSGIGSGAKVDLGDGDNIVFHLESSSGDVSPFGISLSRPADFGTSFQLSATSTGLKGTVGYYEVPGS